MSGMRRLKVGQVLNGLTVLGTIAEVRGRHPVYLVWDHAGWCPLVGKVFALKRRAEREANVLQALAHPNIVRTLGLRGKILLLERLEGPTLEQHAEEEGGRLGLEDALRTAVHIGAALEHAHSRGYLHLDVKPANVILVEGRPVLFDFGSARRLDARPDCVVGTTPYISPEECRQSQTSPASDVFGLGVLLYELLAGELPYPDETRADPFPQLRDPVPLRRLRPSLPKAVADLVMSCLAHAPEDRPPLKTLLPALNAQIRRGPRMWPEGFEPAGLAA